VVFVEEEITTLCATDASITKKKKTHSLCALYGKKWYPDFELDYTVVWIQMKMYGH